MPEPVRHHPLDPRAASLEGDSGMARRPSRPLEEDPLEELARILGETGGYPARPETTIEVGRRATPSKPAPQQLSALEAELFEELRSSVAPEDRVRGNFKREMPPVIPQRPVDDRDIASLSLGNRAPEEAYQTTAEPAAPETPWSDYYSYDEGVAAGSYDPAFAGMPNPGQEQAQWAPEVGRGHGQAGPRPTFDEFGTAEIAVAAQETSPYMSAEPGIRPHSRREEQAAQLAQAKPRSLVTTLMVSLGVLIAGGGAYAGWKTYGDKLSGAPVHITADGKPMKVLPDPTKAPVADAEPSLKADSGTGANKIVSLQEDPVEQVNGRTPEGKEVRVINPGALRPTSDQPHTVKTVIVRPDGTIVSDAGATPVKTQPVRVLDGSATPVAAPIGLGADGSSAAAPSAAQAPMAATEPVGRPVQSPLPVPAPVRMAATPASAPTAPVTAPTAIAPKLQPTAAVPKPQAPAPVPVAPKTTASTAAPMALGPVGPKLASPAPASAPAPVQMAAVPAAPAAAVPSASGEWMVQISASKTDADARRSFAEQSRKYSALAGRSLDVQAANLGDKGMFYRTRVAAGTREQAVALCTQLQSQGGQCMVVKR